MLTRLDQRGADDEGIFVAESVVLGNRRLEIFGAAANAERQRSLQRNLLRLA
jgi:asparagine synthetase B (glutamine-hydrolysing)